MIPIQVPSYIHVISNHFPELQCKALGDGNTYEDLIQQGSTPIPDKQVLDEKRLLCVKQIAKSRINTYRDDYLYDRFVYDGKRWDCDSVSRANITGALSLGLVNGGALPEGVTWRDYDNQNWPVTFQYMASMANHLGTFTNVAYSASWQHKAAIDSMTTIQQVIDYDFEATLWPERDL